MLLCNFDYLKNEQTGLDRVTFCLFGKETFQIFQEELEKQIKI
jgi:hypothetical protein